MRARTWLFALLLSLLAMPTAGAVELPPGGTFIDDERSQFQGAIEAIAAAGITEGCTLLSYCPDDFVTRGQMAVFLARAFGYTEDGGNDYFADDAGEFYETAANRIRHAGVTEGCNPPFDDMFCGDSHVTRAQMAAFLVRARGLTDHGGGDLFVDDDGSVLELAIDRLGAAGITSGCNPPHNDRFCPNQLVTRGQMAAFLARALGLSPINPPPTPEIEQVLYAIGRDLDPVYDTPVGRVIYNVFPGRIVYDIEVAGIGPNHEYCIIHDTLDPGEGHVTTDSLGDFELMGAYSVDPGVYTVLTYITACSEDPPDTQHTRVQPVESVEIEVS